MDNEFHNKVDKMFESRLDRNFIKIKDLVNDRILDDNDMNYDLVMFDTNLNIYKLVNGIPTLVENKNFKAVYV